MTTALALPLAPLIGAGGTLARGTGLVLLTTTKLSPLALLTLLLVLRVQSVPADVDRDQGPVAAVRWLLSYLLPAPGLGWLRRGSARLGRWAADRFAAARGRSRPPPPPLPRAAKRRRSSRPVNVLCMDGGGMRGRNLLVIAEEMELQTGKPLSSLFELVAGTSIGGCGALFLNKYPAPGEATHMARRALRMLQERCFAPDARSYGHLWRDGHLCLDRRREFMLELCGTRQPLRRQRRWLSSSWNAAGPRAFAVASCRRRGGGLEPFLFRTYRATPANLGQRVKRRRERQRRRAGEGGEEGAEAPLAGTSEAEMWQAVEATSAAPSIFPRTRLGGRSFADGGLVANNPTLIALREARALWPHRRIGVVVSLGTGSSRPASTTAVPEAVAELAPGASYFRIEPPSSGVSMIESDEDKLQQMEAATQLYLRSSPVARELCRTLVFQQWWDLIADAGYAVHAWCRDLFPRMDS